MRWASALMAPLNALTGVEAARVHGVDVLLWPHCQPHHRGSRPVSRPSRHPGVLRSPTGRQFTTPSKHRVPDNIKTPLAEFPMMHGLGEEGELLMTAGSPECITAPHIPPAAARGTTAAAPAAPEHDARQQLAQSPPAAPEGTAP